MRRSSSVSEAVFPTDPDQFEFNGAARVSPMSEMPTVPTTALAAFEAPALDFDGAEVTAMPPGDGLSGFAAISPDLPQFGSVHVGTGGNDDIDAQEGTNLVLAGGGDDTISITSYDYSHSGVFLGGAGADTFNIDIGGSQQVTAAPLQTLIFGGTGTDTFNIYFEAPENGTHYAVPGAPILMDYEAGEDINLSTFFVYYGGMTYISDYDVVYSEDLDLTLILGVPDAGYYGPGQDPVTLLAVAGEWDQNALNIDLDVGLGL